MIFVFEGLIVGVFHGFDFKLEPIAPLEPPPPETWTLRGEAWLYDLPGIGCYRVQRSPGGWEWRWDTATGSSVGGFCLRAEDAIVAADEHRQGKRRGRALR